MSAPFTVSNPGIGICTPDHETLTFGNVFQTDSLALQTWTNHTALIAKPPRRWSTDLRTRQTTSRGKTTLPRYRGFVFHMHAGGNLGCLRWRFTSWTPRIVFHAGVSFLGNRMALAPDGVAWQEHSPCNKSC